MTARNLMLTMVLGGLWHGANWTFLIWGALHGAALVIDHSYRRSLLFERFGKRPVMRVFDWTITFHFVCVAWVFFRSPSLDAAMTYFNGIMVDNGAESTIAAIVPVLIACGAFTQLVPPDFRSRFGRYLDNRGLYAQGAFAVVALYLILVMAPAASAPFIYFQF
jgi:D-alanyl-lipoteichoic acid acyltransferase DltB (MBOAT superfamily)